MVQKLNEQNLIFKVNSPDWCKGKLLPILLAFGERSEDDLHKANRDGTLEQIKYRQGWFDAIHTLYSMINGATNPDQIAPSRMGQILSKFGLGR